jgi:3-oxoacyl-(acyl-carrier-protein) synthase
VLLETEEAALARGARPLARLAGIGTAGVPTEPYRFAPDPAAIARAIRGALAAAQAEPGGVRLWFPSRNGVVEMDRAEEAVMSELFGGAVPPGVSVKEAIGEMAAAGGAQIVAACRALADPDGSFPPGAEPRRVLVNSFGAGGNFFSAVFESP